MKRAYCVFGVVALVGIIVLAAVPHDVPLAAESPAAWGKLCFTWYYTYAARVCSRYSCTYVERGWNRGGRVCLKPTATRYLWVAPCRVRFWGVARSVERVRIEGSFGSRIMRCGSYVSYWSFPYWSY